MRNELAGLGMGAGPLLINRVLFAADVGNCRRCRRARHWQLATLARLRERGEATEVFVLKNFAREIAGGRGLQRLTAELWQLA